MASVRGGQDGAGDALAVAATGAEAATGVRALNGTAALTELNWKAAPATAPTVIPPATTASLLMFIVARTTAARHGSIRNIQTYELCITYSAASAFNGIPSPQPRLNAESAK